MKMLFLIIILSFSVSQAYAILGCTQVSGSYIRQHGHTSVRNLADPAATYWVRQTTDSNRAIYPYIDKADCENNPLEPSDRINPVNINDGQSDQCGEAYPLRLTAMPGLTNMPLCDNATLKDSIEKVAGHNYSNSISLNSPDCNNWNSADFPEDFYSSGLFTQCHPESVFDRKGLANSLTQCDKDLFKGWLNGGQSSDDLLCDCTDPDRAYQNYLNSGFKFAQRNVWCSTGCGSRTTSNMRIGKEDTDSLGVFDYSTIPNVEMSHQYVFDRSGKDDFFSDGSTGGPNDLPRSMLKSANQNVNVFIPIQNTEVNGKKKCGIEIRPGVISADFKWTSGRGPNTYSNRSIESGDCLSVPDDNLNSLDPVGLCMVFSAIQPSEEGSDSTRAASVRNHEGSRQNGEADARAGRLGDKSRCRMSDYGFYHRKVGTRSECLGAAGGSTGRPPEEEEFRRELTPVYPGDGGIPATDRCSCLKDDDDPSNDRRGEILCYGWEDSSSGQDYYYFIDCDKAKARDGGESLPFDREYSKISCEDRVIVDGVSRSCCEGYGTGNSYDGRLARLCAARVRQSKK